MASHVVAAIVSIALVVPAVWFLMDRTPPYTFKRVTIEPNPVKQGGEIRITFTVDQTRARCSAGLIYREFKELDSGKLHTFDPIMRAEAPVIAERTFTRIAKLPDNISPGRTLYRGIACYTCNPLHNWLRWPVCVHTPGVEFEVERNR